MKQRILRFLRTNIGYSRYGLLRRIYRFFWGFHHLPRAIYHIQLSPLLFRKYYCGEESRSDHNIVLDAVMQGKRQKFWRPIKYPLFIIGVWYFKWHMIQDLGLWQQMKSYYPQRWKAFILCALTLYACVFTETATRIATENR